MRDEERVEKKRKRLLEELKRIDFRLTDEMLKALEENRKILQRAWDIEPMEVTPVTGWSFPSPSPDKSIARFDLTHNVRPQLLGIMEDLKNGYNRLAGVCRNFNTTLLASAFGCPIKIMENGQDWAEPIITDDIGKAYDLKPPDFREDGLVPEYLEDMAILREVLPEEVAVGNRILLGPTDHVYWLREPNRIFLDVFDHPEAVHKMYSVATETQIRLLKESHRIAQWDFSEDEVHFDTMVHAEPKGGVVFSDDGSMNFSPQTFREFVAPYNRRLLDEFGGGLIHTCGNCEHLLEEYALLPATGVELNPKLVDYHKAREILKGKVIVTYGGLIPAESYEESLRITVREAHKGGLVLSGIPKRVLEDIRRLDGEVL